MGMKLKFKMGLVTGLCFCMWILVGFNDKSNELEKLGQVEVPIQQLADSDSGNDDEVLYITSVDQIYGDLCYRMKNHQSLVVYQYASSTPPTYTLESIMDGIYAYQSPTDPLLNGAYLCHSVLRDGGFDFVGKTSTFNGVVQYQFRFELDYVNTEEELAAYDAYVKEEAAKINNGSNYEKIKAAYKLVMRRIEYDDNYYKTTDCDGMMEGHSVCTGYAMAMQRMLTELGINSRLVSGDTHIWNIVELDGKWYNIDATWDDDGDEDFEWFLKSEKDFEQHTRSAGFEYPECVMSKHSFNTTLYEKVNSIFSDNISKFIFSKDFYLVPVSLLAMVVVIIVVFKVILKK